MKQSGSLFFKNTRDHRKKVQRATDRHKERNKKGGGERELSTEKSTISTQVIFTEPKRQRGTRFRPTKHHHDRHPHPS